MRCAGAVQRSSPCRPLCFPVAASPSLHAPTGTLLLFLGSLSGDGNQSVSEPVACADSQLIIHSPTPTPTPTLLRLSRPLPLSWLRLASTAALIVCAGSGSLTADSRRLGLCGPAPHRLVLVVVPSLAASRFLLCLCHVVSFLALLIHNRPDAAALQTDAFPYVAVLILQLLFSFLFFSFYFPCCRFFSPLS